MRSNNGRGRRREPGGAKKSDSWESMWGPMPTMRELIGLTAMELLLRGVQNSAQAVVKLTEHALQRLDPDDQLSLAERAMAERMKAVANGTAAPPQADPTTAATIKRELQVAADLAYNPAQEPEHPGGQPCEVVYLYPQSEPDPSPTEAS